jgi:hypothetical protein
MAEQTVLPSDKKGESGEQGKGDKKNNKDLTTCQLCTYAENETPRECSICLKHLCKSIRSGQSACSPCLIAAVESGSLQKNEKGQFLDPANRTALATCSCGALYHPMNYDCFLAWLRPGSGHQPLK